MRPESRIARRYHWLSEGLRSFVDERHAAIDGAPGDAAILNMVDKRAERARAAGVELVREGPHLVLRELAKIRGLRPASEILPHLSLPAHHEVTEGDVVTRRIAGALAAAREALPRECCTARRPRFSDPARFSFAHGGKDGHPFPVPLKVYDETLGVLRRAVDRAKLGQDDRLAALRRLDEASRMLEMQAGYDFAAHVAGERARSAEWGGRTARGPVQAPRGQLRLL
jgi:hypothetical protein